MIVNIHSDRNRYGGVILSYHVYIDNVQLFGNDEDIPAWNEFIRSQGIEINEETHEYEGEITDFMGMIVCLEQIVLQVQADLEPIFKSQKEPILSFRGNQQSILDYSHIFDSLRNQESFGHTYGKGTSLFEELFDVVNNGRGFLPYLAYVVCKPKLKPAKVFSTPNHFHCFEFKPGCSCHVKAL